MRCLDKYLKEPKRLISRYLEVGFCLKGSKIHGAKAAVLGAEGGG